MTRFEGQYEEMVPRAASKMSQGKQQKPKAYEKKRGTESPA